MLLNSKGVTVTPVERHNKILAPIIPPLALRINQKIMARGNIIFNADPIKLALKQDRHLIKCH